VSKLRTKYESHEAKRILAGAYDLFVADERVIPSLPKLLGASGVLRCACYGLPPARASFGVISLGCNGLVTERVQSTGPV